MYKGPFFVYGEYCECHVVKVENKAEFGLCFHDVVCTNQRPFLPTGEL